MKIVPIVVARASSTRLPNKILKPFGKSKSIVEFIHENLRNPTGWPQLVLATSNEKSDDCLAKTAQDLGYEVYRGSLTNVHQRLLRAAQKFEADWFFRVNGDSPFAHRQLLSDAMAMISEDTDFITNLVNRTYPYGIAVELIRTRAFSETSPRIKNDLSKEHATKILYETEFKSRTLHFPENLIGDQSSVRLTIDTFDDYERLSKDSVLIENFRDSVDWQKFAATLPI